MQKDLSERLNHPVPSSHQRNSYSQETDSQYDANAHDRHDDERERRKTKSSRNISELRREGERRREESLRDARGRSRLKKFSNGCGDALQGDPCIFTHCGSANEESGVDDGSNFAEIKEAENFCGDGTNHDGDYQDEDDEEEADNGY